MHTKIKNTIPFTVTQKKKEQYLHVNLKKHVQDLFVGKYKALTKEIKVMPSDKYFSSTTETLTQRF